MAPTGISRAMPMPRTIHSLWTAAAGFCLGLAACVPFQPGGLSPEQSAAGFAPQLGNADPVQETLTAGAARLEQANDEGSAVYTVTLTAHYTMKWSDTFED